ncbi:MAG: TonB-dependent receptor [Chlorobi bacterium]|nr:TonB-dependent receptor [Chlorobiota bacterium]
MKLKINVIAVLILLSSMNTLLAQGVDIYGVVTDELDMPLPGVNIIIKGTQTGTVTDNNGVYRLHIPQDNSVVVFSFIGMEPKEVNVTQSGEYNVQLMPLENIINDVIVIGYGTVKKKDLTGSMVSVDGKKLQEALNTDMTESLNGRVSGVVVTKSSNKPGASMSMEIRGLNSINFSNEPLYVINGVPSYSGIKYLNSADIESIDILKDASSTAIYGSRGANGVVIITTKGANNKKGFNIEYSGNVGVKTPTRIPDMIGNYGDGYEYVEYKIELWKNKYGEASLSRPDFLTPDEKRRIKNGEYYDWLREVSSPSVVTNHNIISSGADENTSYSFSLGYTSDQGFLENEDYERITANVHLDQKLGSKFKTGVTTYLSNDVTDHGADEALLNAYFIPPIASPYDENHEYTFIVQPTSSKINPFFQMKNNLRQTKSFFSNFSSYIEYQPFDYLKFKSQVSYQYDNSVYGEWIGKETQQKQGVNPNEAYRSEGISNNLVWDNIATLSKSINKIHQIDAIGLFSLQKETHKGSHMRGEDLPYDSYWHAIGTANDIRDVDSWYWEASMVSFMLRANYSLKQKYMLTLTGRYDGTSRLSEENQWGFMPSVALGWQISEEPFLKNVNVINDLKLRLSYGKSGNNNITHDITLTKLDLSKYTFGTNGENGFGIGDVLGNRNLKWEMTSEYNLGIDFGLFNSRINGTIDAYYRTTDDLIMKRSISTVNGVNSVYQNIGETLNKGIEVSLNTVNISNPSFYWKSSVVFSLNRNEIVNLYGDDKDDLGNRWFIGYPIRVIYDFKQLGIWQVEEEEEAAKYGQSVGHIKVEDVNGDYQLDEKDYQILGSPMPDWTMGFINNFGYRNFDLMIDIYMRIGGLYHDEFTYMFTAWDNEHWNKLDVEYWTPENRSNKYQQVGAQSYYTQVLSQVSGTFLKVRNITLGYNLDKSFLDKIKMNDARVYLAVQNPFTFTDYLGSDPEIIGEDVNTQLSLYPMTFMFGVNVKF